MQKRHEFVGDEKKRVWEDKARGLSEAKTWKGKSSVPIYRDKAESRERRHQSTIKENQNKCLSDQKCVKFLCAPYCLCVRLREPLETRSAKKAKCSRAEERTKDTCPNSRERKAKHWHQARSTKHAA
jgi:hypothetical protein